jgi:dTDP-4-dehydrorhamnose reductase
MRILVTGANGQIGWEVAEQAKRSHDVIGMTRRELDLGDAAMIRHAIRSSKPDVIINAAGYTAVDRAETEPQLAMAINGSAVGVIGEEAQRIGAAVVHYSTDYVFDGAKQSPYLPSDKPNPLSAYGRSKLEGERALAASGAQAIVLRTSWVYGLRGKNFLLAVLRKARVERQLRIVNDQIGAPTTSAAVAHATLDILGYIAGATGSRSFAGREGIHHLSAGGSTTWFGFARRIFELIGARLCPTLIPISSEEFGAPAPRPAYSVLDCSSTREAFGVQIPDWTAALHDLCKDGALDAVVNRIASG